MNSLKVNKVIILCFYFLLLCFPFIIASLYSFNVLFGQVDCKKYFLETNEYYFIPVVFSIITICVVFIVFSAVKKFVSNKYILLIIVFVVSFLFRFYLLNTFYDNINLFSDYFFAWRRALGDSINGRNEYYKFFPTHMNYSFFLSIITSRSLEYDSIRIIVFINILFDSFTAMGVFLLGVKIFQNIHYSFLSAFIYAIFPSSVFYSLTCSPEHICVCCNIFALYLIIIYFSKNSLSYKIFIILLAGILFGIASSLKTFFPIIFIALLIASFYYIKSYRTLFDKFIKITICLCSLLVIEQTTVKGITFLTEKEFSVSLNFADATPHFLCVGLNRQGEGQIHIGNLSRKYITLRVQGFNRKESCKITKESIYNDWRKNFKSIYPFIVSKTIWAWQDDCRSISFFLNDIIRVEEVNNKGEIQFKDHFGSSEIDKTSSKYYVYRRIKKYSTLYTEIMYSLLMICCFFSCITKIKKIEYLSFPILLSDLIIEGFFFLMLVSEAQSRYKCLIFPLICLHAVFFLTTKKTFSRIEQLEINNHNLGI